MQSLCWATTPPPTVPTPALINSDDKNVWLERMKQHLPTLLCQKDQYLNTCFDITPKECTDFAQILTNACLDNATLAIPQRMDTQQKEYWGMIVGRCTNDLFEKFMQPKKRDIPQCKEETKEEKKQPQKSAPKPSQEKKK